MTLHRPLGIKRINVPDRTTTQWPDDTPRGLRFENTTTNERKRRHRASRHDGNNATRELTNDFAHTTWLGRPVFKWGAMWYNDFCAHEYYCNRGSSRINSASDQRWKRMGAEISRRNGDPRTTDGTLPTPTRLRRSGSSRYIDSGRRDVTDSNTVTMTVTTCDTDIYAQTDERRAPTTIIKA